MNGQIISFRLTTKALANGLLAIRRLEPNYQPASIHKMVQLVYYDYCSKMAMGHTDEIPEEIMTEIMMLIPGRRRRIPVKGDKEILAKLNGLCGSAAPVATELYPSKPSPDTKEFIKATNGSNRSSGLTEDIATESESNTVTDFSFLKTLAGEEEDNNE